MTKSRMISEDRLGYGFISPKYLPSQKDEYYLRYEQSGKLLSYFRHLSPDEIKILTENHNTSSEWNDVLVSDPFEAGLIKNTQFYGLVRIGKLEKSVLCYDLNIPAGITNSRIISCDIGDNSAVHDVRYLSHYILGDQCVLFNIDEMLTSSISKFGNGILKDGEDEKKLIKIDLMNETGGRSVQAFDSMIPADAYLWAKFRGDATLMRKLKDLTQSRSDSRRGYYGTVGKNSFIKSCRIIRDVKFGPYSKITGANILEDLTVHSSEEEPTKIGEGVELLHGIVGRGCQISYNSIGIRFVMNDRSNLKYGARLFHSLLGENSTISCCEVQNNLIFPSHEQHHNNSFLIASLVMGQSNIAAGATIGSNHNSRSNDGEIQAGRGFWPGLCATLKHNSKFASFTLIQKGNYPSELNIPLPFSLVSNNERENQLEVMPAYWWMYNMYALARNSSKFQDRDRRLHKVQNIEFDALAPDTAEEIIQAMNLLETWTAEADLKKRGKSNDSQSELAASGKKLLKTSDQSGSMEILGKNMENSRRKVVILKAQKAYLAYHQMLTYYAVKNLIDYLESNPASSFDDMLSVLKGPRKTEWCNLGGQLVPSDQFDLLLNDIKSSRLSSWDKIHTAYAELWIKYPLEKQRHALSVLLEINETQNLTKELWNTALDEVMKIQLFIQNAVYQSKMKDFENPFRKTTFLDEEEMKAVTGVIGDNAFIQKTNRETETFKKRIEAIRKRV